MRQVKHEYAIPELRSDMHVVSCFSNVTGLTYALNPTHMNEFLIIQELDESMHLFMSSSERCQLFEAV